MIIHGLFGKPTRSKRHERATEHTYPYADGVALVLVFDYAPCSAVIEQPRNCSHRRSHSDEWIGTSRSARRGRRGLALYPVRATVAQHTLLRLVDVAPLD